MENNNDVLTVEHIEQQEKRTCKCCGKELPILMFRKYNTGHRHICITCEYKNKGITDKFKNYTSRELIEELRSRGYRGTLKYVKIETVVI